MNKKQAKLLSDVADILLAKAAVNPESVNMSKTCLCAMPVIECLTNNMYTLKSFADILGITDDEAHWLLNFWLHGTLLEYYPIPQGLNGAEEFAVRAETLLQFYGH